MEYFTEQGENHRQVMERIYRQYGRKVKILTQRNIRIGGVLGLFGREGVEIMGVYTPQGEEERRRRDEEERQKILSRLNQGSGASVEKVLEEIQGLKEKLGEARPADSAEETPANIAELEQLLEANDFSPAYIREITARVRRELSLETLDDWEMMLEEVERWIGESISIFQEPARRQKPRVFVLVGPTGVGKTTTIAKLAAVNGFGISGDDPRKVRMITIDNYRIGAKSQIQTYGSIMEIPVATVENMEDLKREIDGHPETDIIFVDTIGKSPRDFSSLAQMNELISACGRSVEIHLAVSATTKSGDIREIMDLFEPFRYQGVVLTKLDETNCVGNLISILSEKKKPISYITDGQMVPQDIEKASVKKMVGYLDGFPQESERPALKKTKGA